MTSYTESAQASGGEQIVILYQVDLNPLGVNEILCFCKHTSDPVTGMLISFLGQTYEGVDVDSDGLEWAGAGASPQPTIRISNVGTFASGLLVQYGNLIGATVTRIRTYGRFLDGHSDAAVAASQYQVESFRVEQKIAHNKVFVQLRLASVIDQEGRMLPQMRILRDTCQWRYRGYNANTGAWDYSKATCPYTAEGYFDINGNGVGSMEQDLPSKRFDTCCKPRYSGIGPYPFGGFRGVNASQ
jgi:lambda family phage minor tail protein L